MNRIRLPFAAGIVLATIVAVIIALSSGSTTNAQPTAAPGSAISLHHTALGRTLVDANGRTLYLFQGDRRNVSKLSPAGQAVWPPFTATVKPRALGGAVATRISAIKKVNGSAQIAYNGHPLYYYVGDHQRGQTLGQGLNQFGARWYALGPSGSALTSVPSSPSTATPTARGSSYGY